MDAARRALLTELVTLLEQLSTADLANILKLVQKLAQALLWVCACT